MRETEATEFVRKHNADGLECDCRDGDLDMRCYESKGYLECLKRAKKLERALRIAKSRYEEWAEAKLTVADKALAEWEKTK